MCPVKLQSIRKYEDVIQIDDDEVVKIFPENILYEVLKRCRSVTEPKGHHEILEVSESRSECCLPFIALTDTNKVIGTPEVKFGKYLGRTESLEKFRN